MSLMSEQLLKAGLVTEEQVRKASKPSSKKNKKFSSKSTEKTALKKTKTRKKQQSDLEKFYTLRSSEENKEKQQALRLKKQVALRKKEMNKKISKLILDNALDSSTEEESSNAEIRYNFVVGTTIKYIFVTEAQQQGLANGELAITFLKGKRCIIPAEIGKQIRVINQDKVVVQVAKE